ncbi:MULTISPECIES: ParB N-terminal domain-containing protein [unclassified Clostridioides]|uniref:ParB/RepB/Spo0J family partition protein n=1 Tax=unclassified Clostridioides TaxID=2635829 RepID=UPI001D102EA1|nr:ParB N-terminal domain-containing protein [Clostridioides sp. ZZV14-6048]MCC0740028.1 ParB N-terminal domain-containing protein [Clostridioides sp. ZZV14-5902]
MAKNFMKNNAITKLENIKNEVQKVELKEQEQFKIEYIHIDDIVPSKKNFYSIDDESIGELAESILEVGLLHNLLVRPNIEVIDGLEYEKYELLSGERRYRAHKRLVELGYKKFQLIPCQVMSLDDVDAEIALISANAHSRPLTDYEKLKETQKLIDLHKLKRANGEKVTGIHNAVSEKLKLKPTQTKRYVSMAKNLIPELEKMLELEKLSVSNASIFSALSKENQRVLYQSLKDKDDILEITKKEAEDLKNRYKDLEEEKNIIERNYIDKIEQLTKENELKENELKEATNGIDEKIEIIKKEMETKIKVKTDEEIGDYLKEIEQLEKAKQDLEVRHEEMKKEQEIELEKTKKEQQELLLKASEDAKIKAEGILKDFEEDKKRLKLENEKIRLENEKLKKELENKNIDESEKKAIYEVKTKLDTVKSDVIRITTLVKNVPLDEKMTKDFDVLKRLFDTLESTLKIHGK